MRGCAMEHSSKSQAAFTVTDEAAELIKRRDVLLASEPRLRGRALADRLGVSEAQILMLERGRSACLLRSEWPEILGKVHLLGTVMAFTRNDSVLHQKIGRYGEVILENGRALVVGEEINLRPFFERWRYGFAVREGILKSLQFCDRFGKAVHKIYLLDDSDSRAFDELVESFECKRHEIAPAVERRPNIIGKRLDFAIDIESFWSEWDAQRDLHEFTRLLKRRALRHIHAFRLAGDERARQLSAKTFGRAVEMAAERTVPIVVQIENEGAVQIHAGPLTNVTRNRRWLNVIDPTFNFHLFEEAIVETWA